MANPIRFGWEKLYNLVGYFVVPSVVLYALYISFLPSPKFNPVAEPVTIPEGVYHEEEIFLMDYAEMERDFKIYAYPGGGGSANYDMTVGKHVSEGYFFKNIRKSHFLTDDPHLAHLFFIPISLQKLRLKEPSVSYKRLSSFTGKEIKRLIKKYPYWNRTLGADHFFVTCLDNPDINIPLLRKNTIRVVCAASYNAAVTAFIPHKDVALPSVIKPFSEPVFIGNDSHRHRTVLGYWRGVPNSDMKKRLVDLWGEDDELDVQNVLAYKDRNRYSVSKFCICPAGSRISDTCITLAIHYGCVPVILNDFVDLPFNGALDWRRFAVVVMERDVHRLKGLLKAKEGADYISMYRNLIKVRRHFKWNAKAVKYDAFHMVMYDLWSRRHVVRY